MNNDILENLRDTIDLYLSMDSKLKSGSVVVSYGGHKHVEPTLDLILVKEELLKQIIEDSSVVSQIRG